jgi:hypothetical protein
MTIYLFDDIMILGIIMGKKMKSFGISGQINDDSSIPRLRQEYQYLMEQDMRSQGYVPMLDLDVQFWLDYNEQQDIYNFEIVLYGVYVGKKKAYQYEGFSGQSLIPKQ